MNRKDKTKPRGLDPPGNEREERILGEMYAAAKEERWDASPGFEARLEARLRDEIAVVRSREVNMEGCAYRGGRCRSSGRGIPSHWFIRKYQ